ncbi:hypothetical protein DFH27DRAFT_648308 [Peziza echinospora]|nr:hypothetical protein DFH27DRAFT_648308 [Peziza echinospora]
MTMISNSAVGGRGNGVAPAGGGWSRFFYGEVVVRGGTVDNSRPMSGNVFGMESAEMTVWIPGMVEVALVTLVVVVTVIVEMVLVFETCSLGDHDLGACELLLLAV